MWLTHSTRTLITQCSQNNHCSWTFRLSPAHRAHHIQTVTYYNSSKTQQPRTTFWKQPGKPGQHFTASGNTRARLIRHIISLSNISTSKLLTENGGTGVCWDQTLPLFRCKPPQPPKTAGQALPLPPVRALRSLPQRQGPNPPQ